MIFFRWVLAYTDRSKYKENLKSIYKNLKHEGYLAIEETNVYDVKSMSTSDNTQVLLCSLSEWLALSWKVDSILNADFALGRNLPEILIDSISEEVHLAHYQPSLVGQNKNILTLGLYGSQQVLVDKKIITTEELTDLISNLDKEIVHDESIILMYVNNTFAWIQKNDLTYALNDIDTEGNTYCALNNQD